jgi:hypothetical protein
MHFLQLPYLIRRQIYDEAGLVSGKTIHMNLWATRGNPKYNEQEFHPYRNSRNLEIRLAEEVYALTQDTQAQADTDYTSRMPDTYQKLVQPLAALLGLRNFFVHLNWGTSCIGSGQALDGREEVERRLEEMVMGEGYDAW